MKVRVKTVSQKMHIVLTPVMGCAFRNGLVYILKDKV